MVFKKVQSIIVEELNLDEEKVTRESRLQEDLGADSLDAVELIMNIEDEFEIQISDEEATDIKTVGELVDFITKKIK
ncbi:MAG: acyl carrier protein [Acholeplasmataceae bacterium]|jgi:acyl carrier protein|nr:acyl carrier protein [Acholeplasmataceae bacterium]